MRDVTGFRLQRVNPYRGLVVDEKTWGDAHDYHRDQQRLHALAFHSPGIAAGLSVSAATDRKAAVVVGPGVALDGEGNLIVVGQERVLPFERLRAGTVFVCLSYQESLVNADPQAPEGAPPNRVVETYKIEAANSLPDEALELARVELSAAGAALTDAEDPHNPRADEIDLRFRFTARTARPVTVRIGIAAGEGAPRHAVGIGNLVQELNNLNGLRALFRGPISLDEGVSGCDLVYIESIALSEPALASVASHLSRGGGVLVDACSANGAAASERDLAAVAEKLGLDLKPLRPASPVLNSRYPFGDAPPGAAEGTIVGAGSFLATTRDYGCAWAGCTGEVTFPRELIRAALEWGVNVAVASVPAEADPP